MSHGMIVSFFEQLKKVAAVTVELPWVRVAVELQPNLHQKSPMWEQGFTYRMADKLLSGET